MGGVVERYASLVARQRGVLSRAQALGLGCSEDSIQRRLATGEWTAVFPAVYRVVGAPRAWLQTLKAATLWAGDGAAISHRAAAALWRMDGFAPGTVELSAPFSLRCGKPGLSLHRAPNLLPSDIRSIDGIPATSASRTLIDLGRVCSHQQLEEALECCLRRGLTTVDRLQSRLSSSGTSGRKGAAALGRLLKSRPPVAAAAESILETRLLQLFRQEELPDPARQLEVRDGNQLIARLDFAFPLQRLAIETDGADHHLRPAKWKSDHDRRNALLALGWICIVATWHQVHFEPVRLVAHVRRTLQSRGWVEKPRLARKKRKTSGR